MKTNRSENPFPPIGVLSPTGESGGWFDTSLRPQEKLKKLFMSDRQTKKRLEAELEELESSMENGDLTMETIAKRNDVSCALAALTMKSKNPNRKKQDKLKLNF